MFNTWCWVGKVSEQKSITHLWKCAANNFLDFVNHKLELGCWSNKLTWISFSRFNEMSDCFMQYDRCNSRFPTIYAVFWIRLTWTNLWSNSHIIYTKVVNFLNYGTLRHYCFVANSSNDVFEGELVPKCVTDY